MNRVYNFNAGPSPLPLEVLEEIRDEMTNFKGTGMGIIEMSHRSKEFQSVIEETKSLLFDLMKLTPDHEIVFIQGGGTMQFGMVPMNLIGKTGKADYAVTGNSLWKVIIFSIPAPLTQILVCGRTKPVILLRSSEKRMMQIPLKTETIPIFRRTA
mgnify:CR=1 FL=1